MTTTNPEQVRWDIGPCGGCGETDPRKRCINCFHPFTPEGAGAPDAASVTHADGKSVTEGQADAPTTPEPARDGGGAIALIAAERQRQREVEGWTLDHDDGHRRGQLAMAAACYALTDDARRMPLLRHTLLDHLWPWPRLNWWKPTPKNRIRELVKAGALIVAEIERVQRWEARNAGE